MDVAVCNGILIFRSVCFALRDVGLVLQLPLFAVAVAAVAVVAVAIAIEEVIPKDSTLAPVLEVEEALSVLVEEETEHFELIFFPLF